jgi:hypothetical protein
VGNAAKTMVLRFRDLVTDQGETISEHNAIITSEGAAWWGWMSRSEEDVPRDYFGDLLDQVVQHRSAYIYLFDTDASKFYEARLKSIAVAPPWTRIGSPEPEKTPEYYNRGRYPAWFKIDRITSARFPHMIYDSFPTRSSDPSLKAWVGKSVQSPELMKQLHVTLWSISVIEYSR